MEKLPRIIIFFLLNADSRRDNLLHDVKDFFLLFVRSQVMNLVNYIRGGDPILLQIGDFQRLALKRFEWC